MTVCEKEIIAPINGSHKLTFDPDGNLYVVHNGSDEVLRYDGTTGDFIDDFVPTGSGGLTGAGPLTFGPDGNLYVVSGGSDEVLRYDGTTGAFIDDFVSASSGGLDSPRNLIFANGDLLVTSAATNEVLRYDGTTGAFIEVYIAAGSGGLSASRDMLLTSEGNLLVLTASEVLLYGAASQAVFTVSLSSPVGQSVTVDVFTTDVTATAGLDYTATPPRTVTFAPGETSLSILIPTLDDTDAKLSETFSVNVANLNGAKPGDLTGVGTILDDEPPPPSPPSLAIDDVTLSEGNSGTTAFTFTVTRGGDTGPEVTVDFATADGTATIADNDYMTNTGTLTFLAGETQKTITVLVNGDATDELDETIFVDLSNISANATFSDSQGSG